MNNLPDKPSELIRLAIDDLEKVEDNPRYKINMDEWHSGEGAEYQQCHVCLAGAVMAETFSLSIESNGSPCDLDIESNRKLSSLDSFRKGSVKSAFLRSNIKPDVLGWNAISLLEDRTTITEYKDSSIDFKIDMLSLANALEGIGY